MQEKDQKRRGVLPSTLSAIEVLSKGGADVMAWPLDDDHDLVTVKTSNKLVKLKLGEKRIAEVSGLDASEVLDSEL